jgi:hypothetical protein
VFFTKIAIDKIQHPKQNRQQGQDHQSAFHHGAASPPDRFARLSFAHFWLSYRPAPAIVEPAPAFCGHR